MDQVVDLNVLPWPWADSSVDEFMAEDLLEHLAPLGRGEGQLNIMAVMREIWRCLVPNGVLDFKVPSTDGRGAWQDPTHVTYWNANTFLYFDSRMPHHQLYDPDFNFYVQNLYESHGGDDVIWNRGMLVAKK